MLLGKVGNKSIAFINHKPFHPGNLQNLEKVWLAEQRAEENEKKQKEMLERRKHEVQIEELRKALREKERQQQAFFLTPNKAQATASMLKRSFRSLEDENATGGLLIPKKRGARDEAGRKKRQKRFEEASSCTVQSKYKENVFGNGHSCVWGSFYDTSAGKWGYACCKQTDKFTKCANSRTV